MKLKPNIGMKVVRNQQTNLNNLNYLSPAQLYELGNKQTEIFEELKLMIPHKTKLKPKGGNYIVIKSGSKKKKKKILYLE